VPGPGTARDRARGDPRGRACAEAPRQTAVVADLAVVDGNRDGNVRSQRRLAQPQAAKHACLTGLSWVSATPEDRKVGGSTHPGARLSRAFGACKWPLGGNPHCAFLASGRRR
jgi:hypothetical protein